MGWSKMAQNRAVKAVPCAPGDGPASKPQLRGQGDPACLPHTGDGSVSCLGGNDLHPALSRGASVALDFWATVLNLCGPVAGGTGGGGNGGVALCPSAQEP